MGWGTGNIGGGSGGLNFKVVGNPQPDNPKENTIWLNTDVEITGKYFQADQPEEMAEGEVWISTGTTSQVAFNALKKGTVMVYPNNAKQMVDGVLVDRTAKTWQDGQWVDWVLPNVLYSRGNENTGLTGGWVTTPLAWDASYGGANATITRNSDNMVITGVANKGSAVHPKNKTDLTNIKTLTFAGKVTGIDYNDGKNDTASIRVWSDFGSNYKENVAVVKKCPVDGTVALDVSSLAGEYIVGFWVFNNGTITVEEFKME